MHAYGMRYVLMTGLALLLACEETNGPTGTTTGLELSAKPSSVLYTYTFSGDIEGTLTNVPASSSDPFKVVNSSGLSFSFLTAATGNTTVCNQEQSLQPAVIDWGEYDSDSWAGAMDLSRRKKSAFHLQITGAQNDGTGSINLVVNDVPVLDTNSGGLAVIQFQDARALISALSYSKTDGDGAPIYDADDRCVNFTITAEPQ